MMIFVFGNPLLEEDSLPIRMMPDLSREFPAIEFIECDPTGNLSELGRDPVILDSVQGIGEVVVIRDIEQISSGSAYSLHDFDLGTNLKIMEKTGMLDSITIIGVPMGADYDEALEQVIVKIRKLQ